MGTHTGHGGIFADSTLDDGFPDEGVPDDELLVDATGVSKAAPPPPIGRPQGFAPTGQPRGPSRSIVRADPQRPSAPAADAAPPSNRTVLAIAAGATVLLVAMLFSRGIDS